MPEDSIETKVGKHGLELSYIKENIGGINATLKEMLEMQKEVIVIMERQTSHEENVRDGFINVHKRIDDHISDEKERLKVHGDYCNIVEHNANKGKEAFNIIKWCGVTFGGLLIGTLFTLFLHAVKVWG